MRSNSKMTKAFWVWIAVIWSSTAYAAQSSLAEGIESIPVRAATYATILAFIGGFAATTAKLAKPDPNIGNIWFEVLKDIACSLFAGLIVFLLVSWPTLGCPPLLQAVLISLAGYAGQRAIEKMVDNGLFAWMDRITGNINKIKPPEAQ